MFLLVNLNKFHLQCYTDGIRVWSTWLCVTGQSKNMPSNFEPFFIPIAVDVTDMSMY